MSATKLKNAPLKEVIFELHWECGNDPSGVKIDRGFDLAQGKFADQLKPDFALHRRLIPDTVSSVIPGVPIHQYWSGELRWPVIQHGQGLVTVNQTEQGYEWAKQYRPLISSTISKLIASYDDYPKFNKVRLQYIDAWDLDGLDPVEFLRENLQTEIKTLYDLPGPLMNISILQRFELKGKSIMSLNISDGINTKNEKKSVLCTTTVEMKGLMDFEGVIVWLEEAHTYTSDFFKKMLNPEFYASLDR
jgi:uncharacterized protein (TIGR04255 family)